MEIRVIGTPAELERATEVIAAAYEIQSQSKPYPCRGNSEQQRQYYTVTEKKDNE